MKDTRELAATLAALVKEDAPPSCIVDAALSAAVRAGASDLHVEPVEAGLSLRLRLDGVLQEAASLPAEVAAPVIARLKVLAGLATYRTDVPQDGRIPAPEGASGDLRLSTYPTVRGEKAVVRLFLRRAEEFELDGLGLPSDVVAALKRALRSREGLVVLTGPAGSGKTTTIYAAIRHLRASDAAPRHVVTIEDPVECLLPGVTQTQANAPAGLTFANCLRSILRQDPEVIVVGEIRDAETASLAAEAALTGHLVVTTLHAGTAAGVFARLVEMGVEPHVVTSVVRLALAQRLVRRLCPECRREGASGWSAPGCEVCLSTGYRGRLPVAEAVPLAAEVRQAVLGRSDLAELDWAARAAGMVALEEAGERLVAAGETNGSEVARVLAGVRAGGERA